MSIKHPLIIDYDMDNDICLLEIESEFAYKAKTVTIAKEKPKLGETLYAISAPLSMHSKTTRFHFHGIGTAIRTFACIVPFNTSLPFI